MKNKQLQKTKDKKKNKDEAVNQKSNKQTK